MTSAEWSSQLDDWKASFYDGEPETSPVRLVMLLMQTVIHSETPVDLLFQLPQVIMHDACDSQTRSPTDAGCSSLTARAQSAVAGSCRCYPILY